MSTFVCPVCATRWKIVAGVQGDVPVLCPLHAPAPAQQPGPASD